MTINTSGRFVRGAGDLAISGLGWTNSTAVNIHVDSDVGDDGNPGTLLAPLATLREAMERIPSVTDREYNVFLHEAVAAYDADVLGERGFFLAFGSINIIGAEYTTLASGTAQATIDSVTLRTTGGLTADEYMGKTAFVTLSAFGGRVTRKSIVANDTTDCILSTGTFDPGAFSFVDITSGDAFSIIEPSVAISFSVASAIVGSLPNSPPLGEAGGGFTVGAVGQHRFRLINLDLVPSGAFAVVENAGIWTGYGIETTALTVLKPPLAGVDDISASLVNGQFEFDGETPDYPSLFTGWGFYNTNAFQVGSFIGFLCLENSMVIDGGGYFQLMGGRITGGGNTNPAISIGGTSNVGRSTLKFAKSSITNGIFRIEAKGATDYGTAGISATRGAELYLQNVNIQADANGSGEHINGVLLDGGEAIATNSVTLNAAATGGGGATGYGVYVRGGGRFITKDDIATGATYNYAVGETPATDNAVTVTRGAPLVATTPADGSKVIRVS